VYARNPNRRNLTFGVSGMLWNRSLVMYDAETMSHWSHLLGEAMDGPLRETKLEQIPSVMTTWESWRQRHPETTVLWLPRSSRDYRRGFYREPQRFVLGLADVNPPRAWHFEQLMTEPILNEEVDEQPIVVTFDPDSVTARAFSRTVRGDTLDFERDARGFLDRQTRSLWDRISGKCVEGHYEGEVLEPRLAIVSFRNTWLTFHPETRLPGHNEQD